MSPASPASTWTSADSSFIDSIGINTLVAGLRVAQRQRIGYHVVNASGKVRHHLEFLGLDSLLAPETGNPTAAHNK